MYFFEELENFGTIKLPGALMIRTAVEELLRYSSGVHVDSATKRLRFRGSEINFAIYDKFKEHQIEVPILSATSTSADLSPDSRLPLD